MFRYAEVDTSGRVVRFMTLEKPADPAGIKVVSGKRLLRPVVTDGGAPHVDARYYMLDPPTYDVRDDSVVERFPVKLKPDVEKQLDDDFIAKIEEMRSAYIPQTFSAGWIYTEKEREAVEFVVDSKAGRIGAYPMLDAGVGVEASTIDEVAELYLKRAARAKSALARIERLRLIVKGRMAGAKSFEERLSVFQETKFQIDTHDLSA